MDAGRPELVACLDYLREGDLLLVTKIDRLARSTSDLYKIISQLQAKGVEFKVLDDPSIDTTRMIPTQSAPMSSSGHLTATAKKLSPQRSLLFAQKQSSPNPKSDKRLSGRRVMR